MDNQKERVLAFLREKGSKGAFTYDFFDLKPPIIRPAARIDELRKEGFNIKTIRVDEGNFKYILQEGYEYLTTEELLSKKEVAESWLRLNEEHPKYTEALRKYEFLCEVIKMKESGLLT